MLSLALSVAVVQNIVNIIFFYHYQIFSAPNAPHKLRIIFEISDICHNVNVIRCTKKLYCLAVEIRRKRFWGMSIFTRKCVEIVEGVKIHCKQIYADENSTTFHKIKFLDLCYYQPSFFYSLFPRKSYYLLVSTRYAISRATIMLTDNCSPDVLTITDANMSSAYRST